MGELTLDDWMRSALNGLEQTVVALLAYSGVEEIERTAVYPTNGGRFGAFIPLVCDTETVQVALVADRETCTQLAAAMLYENAYNLDPQDIADAIGELLNVTAGVMESEISERDPSVDLGLPVVIDGHLVPTHEMELSASHLAVDDLQVDLVILRRSRTLSSAV